MSRREELSASGYDFFSAEYYEKYKQDPTMLEFARRTNEVINEYLKGKNVSSPEELSPDDRYELEQILASKVWKLGGDQSE